MNKGIYVKSRKSQMIPKKINRHHIIEAIKKIEKEGIPKKRMARLYALSFRGKKLPPKYVISVAAKLATGRELTSEEFEGGRQTNTFLRKLGFKIIETAEEKEAHLLPQAIKKTHHNERCPECKRTILRFLKEIFGEAEQNYRFDVGTKPEDFRGTPFYKSLAKIYKALQDYRGFKNFVKTKILPHCDFFVPNPGFVVEFDESQHFTLARKIALENYPEDIKLGFDKKRWIELCEKINAKDNNPPYRDEQRAWYDTLRDFLPEIKGLKPTVRLYSKEFQWCNLNPNDIESLKRFRNLIGQKSKNWVATVILESNGHYTNRDRMKTLSTVVPEVLKNTTGDGVILFPGGLFKAGKKYAKSLYKWVEKEVKSILKRHKRKIIVCLGIDGRGAKDQIAIAINKRGIQSIGRKFNPTKDEKNYIEAAKNYLYREDGKPRIFSLNGKRYYLAVCYDVFGIRQLSLPNPEVNVVLSLVHEFWPRGEEASGEVYFAKLGFACASKCWNCPVFGSTVFFNRNIPKNWPSGVFWNKGNKNQFKWKYRDNPLKPNKEFHLNISEGKAIVRIFELD